MSINKGSTPITDIKKGSNQVTAVYKGDQLIWSKSVSGWRTIFNGSKTINWTGGYTETWDPGIISQTNYKFKIECQITVGQNPAISDTYLTAKYFPDNSGVGTIIFNQRGGSSKTSTRATYEEDKTGLTSRATYLLSAETQPNSIYTSKSQLYLLFYKNEKEFRVESNNPSTPYVSSASITIYKIEQYIE